MGFEPVTYGFQIRHANHLATLNNHLFFNFFYSKENSLYPWLWSISCNVCSELVIHICCSLVSLFLSPVWLLMYWHCKEKVGLDWFMGCSQERQHTNKSGFFIVLKGENSNDDKMFAPRIFFCDYLISVMSELFYFVVIIVYWSLWWSLCIDHWKVPYCNFIAERESGNTVHILINKVEVGCEPLSSEN